MLKIEDLPLDIKNEVAVHLWYEIYEQLPWVKLSETLAVKIDKFETIFASLSNEVSKLLPDQYGNVSIDMLKKVEENKSTDKAG